ncbi:hypothetical protein F5876DRAFT_78490 [Lentinula aff. lateritia]|uniref:Uncharacterized protein n=1 Tax=Lentinula aff. lateritia TaxID=2804960 RepID=A0ACC1TVN5_9AGAR|nr:hypothetical protein F5876DRAFT_78490 [Lentinula aff. lateritia]
MASEEQLERQRSTAAAPKTGRKRSKHLVTYKLRYAGFPIPHSDALAWANRIRKADGKSLLPDQAEYAGEVMFTIESIVQAAGGECCVPHGRWQPGQPYELYLICTHYEEGEWRRVNGILEPGNYFVESKTFTGISYGPFETCHATTFD